LFSIKNFPVVLIAIAAAITVLGARWKLVEFAGSPVPYHDQWAAEGPVLYQPAVQNRLQLASFLYPHNEHHIVPTKVLAYALFRANGQWDARLQMTANAVLASLLLFPLLALFLPWNRSIILIFAAAGLTWLYCQPIFYENSLWGFQSQFYFLVLFSLWQLRGMLLHAPFSVAWWSGAAAGLLAISSMGSGILASAAVALTAAGIGLSRTRSRRDWLPTATLASMLFLFGMWWLPPLPAATHHFNAAISFHTFVHALAFPSREFSWIGPMLWLPYAGLASSVCFRRTKLTGPIAVLFASGLWALMQMASIGYARPETGPVLANRYDDLFVVGLVVNGAALAWIWSGLGSESRFAFRRLVFVAFVTAWLGQVSFKAVDSSRTNGDLVRSFPAVRQENIDRLAAFVATNDESFITSVGHPHVPTTDPASLVGFLRVPELRSILPAEIRAPVFLHFSSPEGTSLSNALPVSVPNHPGRHHRGTYFPSAGPAGVIDVTSDPVSKAAGSGLIFYVAGDLRRGQTELRIHNANHRVVAVITDLRADTLTPVTIAVPGPFFSVEVFDQSADYWIAFLEPVEIGPLSRWSVSLLGNARALQWIGLATFVIAALIILVQKTDGRASDA
jgi:hypothetical protein